MTLLCSPSYSLTNDIDSLSQDQQYQNRPYYDSVLSNESIGSVVSTPYHLIYGYLDSGKNAPHQDSQFSGQLSRLAKMFFLELPLIHYAELYQHEFGHGFRARDFGKSSDYQFGLPYPYRLFTRNHDLPPGRAIVRGSLDTFERSVVIIGGLESELILSQLLLDNAALSGGIERSITNLYFFLKTSTLFYGDTGKDGWESDIKNADWAKDVKQKALISLLDPMLFSAMIANFDYIATGDYILPIPWFSLGDNFRVLPSFSYYLIPFGESYEMQVLASFGENILRANIADWRFVNALDKNASGTRGWFTRWRYTRKIPSRKITPNLDIAVSQQPYYGSGYWSKTSLVWFIRTGMEYKISTSTSLTASIGKKNRGYLPHTPIKEGTIYSFGLSFSEL